MIGDTLPPELINIVGSYLEPEELAEYSEKIHFDVGSYLQQHKDVVFGNKEEIKKAENKKIKYVIIHCGYGGRLINGYKMSFYNMEDKIIKNTSELGPDDMKYSGDYRDRLLAFINGLNIDNDIQDVDNEEEDDNYGGISAPNPILVMNSSWNKKKGFYIDSSIVATFGQYERDFIMLYENLSCGIVYKYKNKWQISKIIDELKSINFCNWVGNDMGEIIDCGDFNVFVVDVDCESG